MTPVMHVTTGSAPSRPDKCKQPKCFIRTVPNEENFIFREFPSSPTPCCLYNESRNANVKFYLNKEPSLPNGTLVSF